MTRKYSKGASKKVEQAMHELKEGTLKSGRSGKTVKSRTQAIAIGLSEARPGPAKRYPRRRASDARACPRFGCRLSFKVKETRDELPSLRANSDNNRCDGCSGGAGSVSANELFLGTT